MRLHRHDFERTFSEEVGAGEWAMLPDGGIVVGCPWCGTTGLLRQGRADPETPPNFSDDGDLLGEDLACPGKVCNFCRQARLIGWKR